METQKGDTSRVSQLLIWSLPGAQELWEAVGGAGQAAPKQSLPLP